MTEEKTAQDLKVIHIPETLPVLPLFNMIVFPKMMLPMEVFGDQSLQLVDEAMAKDRIIGSFYPEKARRRRPTIRKIFTPSGPAPLS